jgi:hypothetical protein
LPDKAGIQNTTGHPVLFEAGGGGIREKIQSEKTSITLPLSAIEAHRISSISN